MKLPQRYVDAIENDWVLDAEGKAKLVRLLAVLYEIYASPPPPIDDSGSVWF